MIPSNPTKKFKPNFNSISVINQDSEILHKCLQHIDPNVIIKNKLSSVCKLWHTIIHGLVYPNGEGYKYFPVLARKINATYDDSINFSVYSNQLRIEEQVTHILAEKSIAHSQACSTPMNSLIFMMEASNSLLSAHIHIAFEKLRKLRTLNFDTIYNHPDIQELDALIDLNPSLQPTQIHTLLHFVAHLIASSKYSTLIGIEKRVILNNLIKKVFTVITNACQNYTFDNTDYGSNPCYDWVNGYLIDLYYEKTFGSKKSQCDHSDEGDFTSGLAINFHTISLEKLQKVDLKAFIKTVHDIPHSNLKRHVVKKMIQSALDRCKSAEAMMAWWPLIHALESEFHLERVRWDFGYISYDNSTERLIKFLVATPDRLLQELVCPTPHLQEFPKAVKRLFTNPESRAISIISILSPQLLTIIASHRFI